MLWFASRYCVIVPLWGFLMFLLSLILYYNQITSLSNPIKTTKHAKLVPSFYLIQIIAYLEYSFSNKIWHVSKLFDALHLFSIICLEVKLLSVLQLRSYPGHFQVFVHAHILVAGVVDMIKERHGYTFRDITIYYEDKDSVKVPLPHDKSLEDCGFTGGTSKEPQLVNLYYDFNTEVNDCPIVQCDHYFTYEKPTRNSRDKTPFLH